MVELKACLKLHDCPTLEVILLELGKWISKRDSLAMLEIAHACLSCKTDDHYRKLIGQLKHLLFFECFICGFADKRYISYDRLASDSFNTGYPQDIMNPI